MFAEGRTASPTHGGPFHAALPQTVLGLPGRSGPRLALAPGTLLCPPLGDIQGDITSFLPYFSKTVPRGYELCFIPFFPQNYPTQYQCLATCKGLSSLHSIVWLFVITAYRWKTHIKVSSCKGHLVILFNFLSVYMEKQRSRKAGKLVRLTEPEACLTDQHMSQ